MVMRSGKARFATAADVDELVRLRRLMFEAMGVDATSGAWQAAAALTFATEMDAGRLVAVVVDAPDGVGLAASGVVQFESRLPSPERQGMVKAYISSMSTDPRWRRRGFASAVLALVLEECRRRDVVVAGLHATESGRPVYERAGFLPRAGYPEMRWFPGSFA
jgi:GNAT superfamily N-acetyltransferase